MFLSEDQREQTLGHAKPFAVRFAAGEKLSLMLVAEEVAAFTQLGANVAGWVGGDTGSGNGFGFEGYTTEALIEAVERMKAAFADSRAWRRLMQNCFAADFSWDRAARDYLAWFERLKGQRATQVA